MELLTLFVQLVRLACACGLVKLGSVAVDGTQLKANASRHKAMSYKHMPVSPWACAARWVGNVFDVR